MKKIISSVLAAAMSVSLFTVPLKDTSAEVHDFSSVVLTARQAQENCGANVIISRSLPAYSGKSQEAGHANDDKYYTFWNSAPEDYIAYDLSSVPQSQRQECLQFGTIPVHMTISEHM